MEQSTVMSSMHYFTRLIKQNVHVWAELFIVYLFYETKDVNMWLQAFGMAMINGDTKYEWSIPRMIDMVYI